MKITAIAGYQLPVADKYALQFELQPELRLANLPFMSSPSFLRTQRVPFVLQFNLAIMRLR